MALHGLFMGINAYPPADGYDLTLAGCVNDARDLQKRFRSTTTSTLLLDSEATRAGMVATMQTLLRRLRSGDTAIITFSGHGTAVPDLSGDEPDLYDEALVPYDHQDSLLLDDELATILSHRPSRTRVFLFTDSCNSGTVFRVTQPAAGLRTRFAPFERLRPKLVPRVTQPSVEVRRRRSDAPVQGIIHISGCRDYEYSYDAEFAGRPNGAATFYLLQAHRAVSKLRGGTVVDWYKSLRKRLPSQRYPQTPVLNVTTIDRAARVPS